MGRQIDFSITSSPTEKPSMAPSVAPSDEVVTLRAPSGHVDSSMDEPTPMSGGCSSGLATAMARICGVLVVVVSCWRSDQSLLNEEVWHVLGCAYGLIGTRRITRQMDYLRRNNRYSTDV